MSIIRNLIENERPDIHGTGRLSTVASNVLLSGNLALENYAVTKNFATVLYTGNGSTQDIDTGISSVDFTVSGNGSGYWLDRSTFEVKTDAGDVVSSGECIVNISKVHIKSRSEAYNNFIYDSLRGKYIAIFTDTIDAEIEDNTGLTGFNANGISVSSKNGVNKDTATYVLYQTLYTHLKWGTTNQNKKYVEAFNPVTRETMIIYEGSGNDNHEIPHSLGIELSLIEQKNLTNANSWRVFDIYSGENIIKYLDADTANTSDVNAWSGTAPSNAGIYVGNAVTNTANTLSILYGKAKSENWTIVYYTGTGAAGNFVETKDVYGVPRIPARVIIKRIDDTGKWQVVDNKRGTSSSGSQIFNLNLSDAEFTGNTNCAYITGNGFSTITDDPNYNASGGRYIALVEFDTNADGGDGYFNMPTDDSNLNLTDGVFSYTDGKDSNGYVRSTESISGTTTIDFAGVSDGKHWVAKAKDGGYGFYKGLSNGLYNKENADDNRLVFNPDDGKVYTTTGGELITNNDFSNGTTGWTASTGSTISAANNILTHTQGTTDDYTYVFTSLTVEAGTKHKLYFNVNGYSIRFMVGYSEASSELYDIVATAISDEIEILPTSDTIYITMMVQSAANDVSNYINGISCYKSEATLDQPIEPISFLPNPVMVASETPQYVDYNEELVTNVTDSLEVSDTIKCDNYMGKNACTAWVNFDGTDGTIRDSYNVASVVRNAAGVYKIIFAEAMVTVNYVIAGVKGDYDTTNAYGDVSVKSPTVSDVIIETRDSGNSLVSVTYNSIMFFGGKN